MKIENPQSATLVPLMGAFNAVPGGPPIPGALSFKIDWTKGGEGQDILREHFRSGSPGRIEHDGKHYSGVFEDLGGFNTEDGFVVVGVK